MSSKFDYKIEGLNEAVKAFKENSQRVVGLVGKFLIRGLAEYKKIIIRDPWRIGMTGGGAPVLTGNLRDTHITETSAWEARIYPSASYAEKVHRRRPWLDYAKRTADGEIQKLEEDLMKEITGGLAK